MTKKFKFAKVQCNFNMEQQINSPSYRKQEITESFISALDKHIEDLKTGRVETSYEINEFAQMLFINPNHLSDTIREVLGKSPCGLKCIYSCFSL